MLVGEFRAEGAKSHVPLSASTVEIEPAVPGQHLSGQLPSLGFQVKGAVSAKQRMFFKLGCFGDDHARQDGRVRCEPVVTLGLQGDIFLAVTFGDDSMKNKAAGGVYEQNNISTVEREGILYSTQGDSPAAANKWMHTGAGSCYGHLR